MSNPWGAPNQYGYPPQHTPQAQIPQGNYMPQWNQAPPQNLAYQYAVQPSAQFSYAPTLPQSHAPPLNPVPTSFPQVNNIGYGPTVVPFPQQQIQHNQSAFQGGQQLPVYQQPTSAFAQPIFPAPTQSTALLQPTSGGGILQPNFSASGAPLLQPNVSSTGAALLQPTVMSSGSTLLQPTTSTLPPVSSTVLRPTPAVEKPTLQLQVPLGAPKEMAKPAPKPLGPTITPTANPLDALFGQAAAEKPTSPRRNNAAALPPPPKPAEPKAPEKPKAFDWGAQDYKSIFAKAVDSPSLVTTTNAFQEFPDALQPGAVAPPSQPAAPAKPASAPAAEEDDWGAFQAPPTAASAPSALPVATPASLPFGSSLLTTTSSVSSTTPIITSQVTRATLPEPSNIITPSPSALGMSSLASASGGALAFGFGASSATASLTSALITPTISPATILKPLSPAPASVPTPPSVDDEEFDSFQSAAPVLPPPRAATPPKATPLLATSSPLTSSVSSPVKSSSVFVPLTPFGKDTSPASNTAGSKLPESKADFFHAPMAAVSKKEPDAISSESKSRGSTGVTADFFAAKEATLPAVDAKTAKPPGPELFSATKLSAPSAANDASQPAETKNGSSRTPAAEEVDFFTAIRSGFATPAPLASAPRSEALDFTLPPTVNTNPTPTVAATPAAKSNDAFSAFTFPDPVVSTAKPATQPMAITPASSFGATPLATAAALTPPAATVDDDEWGAFEAPPATAAQALPLTRVESSTPLESSLASSPVVPAAVLSPALASSPVVPHTISLVLASSPVAATNGLSDHKIRTVPPAHEPPVVDCVSADLQEILHYLVGHYRLDEAAACAAALKAHSDLPALQLAYSAAKEDDRLEEAMKLRKEIDAAKKATTPSADAVASWRRATVAPTPFSLLAKLQESGASDAVIARFRADHSQLFSSDFTKTAKADPARALTLFRAAVAAQELLLNSSEDPVRVLELCKRQLLIGLEFVKQVRSRATEEASVSKLVFGSPKVVNFVNALKEIHLIALQVLSRAQQPAPAADLKRSITSTWNELVDILEPEGLAIKRNVSVPAAITGYDPVSCSLCGVQLSRSAGGTVENRHFHAACANFYKHLWRPS